MVSGREPALVKLVEEIGKQTSLSTRQSPAYSHQSQAYVEGWHCSLFAQFRALLFDFCDRYKLEPSEIKMGGSFSQHMLRHAVWLLNRFQLHSSDQKTSFQRRWGVPFSDPVLPFGELVLAQTQHAESAKLDHRLQPQRSLAIWLGRSEATGEHILAKANNTSPVRSRTVTRLSLEEACNLATFKTISIPAPELSSSASVKMAKEGDQPTDQQGGESKLRLDVPPQAFTQPPQQRPTTKASTSTLSTSFGSTTGLGTTFYINIFATATCSFATKGPTTSSSNTSFAATSCSATSFATTSFATTSFATASQEEDNSKGPRTSSHQASQYLGKG